MNAAVKRIQQYYAQYEADLMELVLLWGLATTLNTCHERRDEIEDLFHRLGDKAFITDEQIGEWHCILDFIDRHAAFPAFDLDKKPHILGFSR